MNPAQPYRIKFHVVNGIGQFILPSLAQYIDRLSVNVQMYDSDAITNNVDSVIPKWEIAGDDILVTLTANVCCSNPKEKDCQVLAEVKFTPLPIQYINIDNVTPLPLIIW